ncbi:hypothetical protein Godav_024757, partial [Gossypium davidsonii]|nr:hypothetical protein [Gossypium davidsonii]
MSVCEMGHNEDIADGNGNGDDGGNGKLRVEKKKPKRKRDKLKCFLCDGSHMLKKCLKKFALKEKLVGKALILGSSARGVKTKEAKRNDGSYKEPKKLGSSKRKVEAGVKGKVTSELGESSKGLPPKEEVILPSNLKGNVTMKTVKLRLMRLELSEASELVESSKKRSDACGTV